MLTSAVKRVVRRRWRTAAGRRPRPPRSTVFFSCLGNSIVVAPSLPGVMGEQRPVDRRGAGVDQLLLQSRQNSKPQLSLAKRRVVSVRESYWRST